MLFHLYRHSVRNGPHPKIIQKGTAEPYDKEAFNRQICLLYVQRLHVSGGDNIAAAVYHIPSTLRDLLYPARPVGVGKLLHTAVRGFDLFVLCPQIQYSKNRARHAAAHRNRPDGVCHFSGFDACARLLIPSGRHNYFFGLCGAWGSADQPRDRCTAVGQPGA